MEKDTTLNSLANKTGERFDKAFIIAMTKHHNQAIAMARLAQQISSKKEILKLSKDIISAQTRENEQMRAWKNGMNAK